MIALATCQSLPDLTLDDRLFADALRERGVEVRAAVWDDPAVQWADFDRVVVRSTWDYHLRAGAFLAWADRVGERLVNGAELVRWNADKGYLLDLEGRGVAIVPTVRLRPGDDAGNVLAERGWSRAVAKPVVSAAAYGVRIVTGSVRAEADLLLQPFVEEIVSKGEWSFVFLAGAFSHAVVKRPAAGDFRVQEEYGGTVARAEPSKDLVLQASTALEHLPRPWTYARVDAVETPGRLLLVELELIEPELFFRFDSASADRLAAAVLGP